MDCSGLSQRMRERDILLDKLKNDVEDIKGMLDERTVKMYSLLLELNDKIPKKEEGKKDEGKSEPIKIRRKSSVASKV